MAIEDSLGEYLEDNVALAATHIHALRLPQNPIFPALVFQRISTVRDYTHQGDSNFTECRFQVTCWATSYAAVRQLAKQVCAVIGGLNGHVGDVYIGHCLNVGDHDIYEPLTKLFQAPLDFMIAFNE